MRTVEKLKIKEGKKNLGGGISVPRNIGVVAGGVYNIVWQ